MLFLIVTLFAVGVLAVAIYGPAAAVRRDAGRWWVVEWPSRADLRVMVDHRVLRSVVLRRIATVAAIGAWGAAWMISAGVRAGGLGLAMTGAALVVALFSQFRLRRAIDRLRACQGVCCPQCWYDLSETIDEGGRWRRPCSECGVCVEGLHLVSFWRRVLMWPPASDGGRPRAVLVERVSPSER